MLIGMLASHVFMPNLLAQRDKFAEIECTSLTVVDERGSVKLGLGCVGVLGKEGKVKASLVVTENGAAVAVFGKDKRQAVIGINEYGNGDASIWDKYGYRQ